MIPEPTSFRTDNNYRIALFPQDTRGDFEKMEEMLADARAAARSALNNRHAIEYEVFKQLQKCFEIVENECANGHLLGDKFCAHASSIVETLERRGSDRNVEADTVVRDMRQAVMLATRVGDLISAEHDIGFHRRKRP
jgi:hypothetical protein